MLALHVLGQCLEHDPALVAGLELKEVFRVGEGLIRLLRIEIRIGAGAICQHGVGLALDIFGEIRDRQVELLLEQIDDPATAEERRFGGIDPDRLGEIGEGPRSNSSNAASSFALPA